MSFEEAYENYLLYAIKRHKKESFNSANYIFKARILPYFKERKLLDLTKNDILEWQLKIDKLHLSNNYNRLLYFTFSSFFEYCVEFMSFPHNVLEIFQPLSRNYSEKT